LKLKIAGLKMPQPGPDDNRADEIRAAYSMISDGVKNLQLALSYRYLPPDKRANVTKAIRLYQEAKEKILDSNIEAALELCKQGNEITWGTI
jgi:hypothetical protein